MCLHLSEKNSFRHGLKKSFPIMTGYVPIAIAYGVIGVQSGIPVWVLVAMSLVVYAGASQFMAMNLFVMGTSPVEMIVAVGILNLRHVVMGLSFQSKVRFSLADRLITSLGLTDETFAVLSLDKNLSGLYTKGVMLGSYLSWVMGTITGILFGNVIPPILSQGLEIAIYTLFITLLISSLKLNAKMFYVPLVSMVSNFILSQYLSTGLSILFSILIGALAGTVVGGDDNE